MLTQIAQITNPSIGNLTDRVGEGGTGFLGDFLSVVITVILIVGGVYFFFQFLTGAVAWIGSGGDKAALEAARSKILHAGIGLVLLFAAFAVIALVENVFGVGILKFDIPTIAGIGGGGPVSGDTGNPCPCPPGQLCNNLPGGTNTCWTTSDF